MCMCYLKLTGWKKNKKKKISYIHQQFSTKECYNDKLCDFFFFYPTHHLTLVVGLTQISFLFKSIELYFTYLPYNICFYRLFILHDIFWLRLRRCGSDSSSLCFNTLINVFLSYTMFFYPCILFVREEFIFTAYLLWQCELKSQPCSFTLCGP